MRFVLLHGSRGAGKTWWVQRAAERAGVEGFHVSRVVARHQSIDATALSAVASAAGSAPWCVVIDDVDLLDIASRSSIRLAVEAAGGIAIASAGVSTAFEGALPVRIEPMAAAAVADFLRASGVAPGAAQRCAAAAGGNPGLAVSLADGLSDAQRSDQAAVPEIPRLAAAVAVVLHDRLQALGERACRALVVAAADEDGELVAIRAALRALGEDGTALKVDDVEDPLASVFDTAQHAGIVDIVGARVVFTDPWLRLAAYHLVAPGSRRAAHRALAAAYAAPRQGEVRVRHLVAAASGPSDAVAEALMTVASAAARRGERATAARMSRQAAELAVDHELRSGCLLRSAGWCLDTGDLSAAQQLVREMDGVTAEEQAAACEVSSLLHGEGGGVGSPGDGRTGVATEGAAAKPVMSQREVATWVGRRQQRLEWSAAAAAGLHARVVAQVGSAAAPAELLARAAALRHAGLVRDAVDLVERTLSALPAGTSALRRDWKLLETDLAVLAGRADRLQSGVAAESSPVALSLHTRTALALDPTSVVTGSAVFVPVGEPLHTVRSTMLRGITSGQHTVLAEAAEAADAASLPVEAGEAWLFAADFAARGGVGTAATTVGDYLGRASGLLHRCAVRGWDSRLQHLAAQQQVNPAPAAAPADPALDALSTAEWRVAAAVAGGLTNREVAATLFLSVKTVDFHLQQIYRKLALRSRTELAVRVAGRAHNAVGHGAPANQGAGG